MRDVTAAARPAMPLQQQLTQTGSLSEQGVPPPLGPRPAGGEEPLSFSQQGLWFLEQWQPGLAAYNTAFVLKLRGRLERQAWRQALRGVVARHESLRTVFQEVEGTVVQRVLPHLELALEVEEVGPGSVAEREAEALRRATGHARRPFDLRRGPLVRACLFPVSDTLHVGLLCVHHIIADGWSIGVLVRELSVLYQAALAGQPAELPALAVQYADWAHWQRRALSGRALEEMLGWWRERLAGAPAALELPTARPRPPVQSFRGARLPVRVEPRVAKGVWRLALLWDCTPYMVLLAALKLLLHRYSGQEDLVVGSPTALRTHEEVEGVVGFFANTLALRTDLSGDPDFGLLVKRVREGVLEAQTWQEVPFERLVAELAPRRDVSRHPIFQVMFILQTQVMPPFELPGVEVEAQEADTGCARFDLLLSLVGDSTQGLSGYLEYAAELFEPAAMERLLQHWSRALEQLVRQPTLRLSEVELLGKEERQRLVEGFNRTQVKGVLAVPFWGQVPWPSDAVAVESGGLRLTYGQLWERSGQLAHELCQRGVGPEERVGLCVQRGVDMVVALLGVLRAGGAYVPLDPSWPRERLEYMLLDSGARVLLTQRALEEQLPASGVARVFLDEVEDGPALREEPPVLDEQLAYILYTSGSTGRPKGVGVGHRALSNFLRSMARAPGLSSSDVVVAVTSLSFDIAALEVYLPLVVGARLVVASHEQVSDGVKLRALVEQAGATVVQGTPATWRMLLEAGWKGSPSVRVLCGGEALTPPLATALLACAGEVWNVYGPTETTIWSTAWRLPRPLPAISVGTPIDNTRVYVLDAHGRPVPVGVVGEVYLGGWGVARGYWRRPELTAERFVPDGVSGLPGQRLYRTGDLGRWQEDGTLVVLGRVDSQVKVRGFRIELGEIESALQSHASVAAAACVVREDRGHAQLVGYIVPREGTVDFDTLRQHLRRSLPEYMVPSALVLLEALPLTPNGKVDRKALPAPRLQEHPAPSVAPRNPTERQLASIWCQVLRVPEVSIHEDFFQLGGDSLLSLQVVMQARRAGLEFSTTQLFQHPTVASLAAGLQATSPRQLASEAQASGSASAEDLPLTPHQRWYVDTFDVEHHAWAITFLCEMPGDTRPELLEASVAVLHERHDVLRLRMYRREDGWRGWGQRMLPPGHLPRVEVLEMGGLPPEARDEAILDVARRFQARLSIVHGPVLALALCRFGGTGPDKLVLSLHHSVFDAYSLGFLLEDFFGAYRQLAQGQPPRLPPPSASFQQYLLATHAYGRSQAMEEARAFWLHPARLRAQEPMPVDRAGGQHTTHNSRRLVLELPPTLASAIPGILRSLEGASLNEVILFGLARAYARWSGGRELRLDLEHNGRTGLLPEVDLALTLGPTNIKYPVTLPGNPEEEPRKALEAVRDALRQALQRALGYGWLRYGEDEGARQQLAACGAPQVFFNNRGSVFLPAQEEASVASRVQPIVVPRLDDAPSPISYDLMIEVEGSNAALKVAWVYSSALHHEETIRSLAEDLFAQVAALGEGA